MNEAYLLSIDGNEIPVECHPSIHIEEDFDDICTIVNTYGGDKQKELVTQYKKISEVKEDIIRFYCENWCKVRPWGTFCEEVTFRITSSNLNWYNTIVEFLLKHPAYSNSKITVETDKLNGVRKVYWDNVSYKDAIDPKYETILASKLPNYESLIML